MKFSILILFLIYTLNIYSQSVDIIKRSDLKKLPETEVFAIIEPTTDTSEIKYVATIQGRDKNKKSNIEFLYFEIRKTATKIGANCFKIKSFERGGDRNEAILILDCYVADEKTLKLNIENREKNVVYIFGNEREGDQSTSYKLNGKEKEIESGSFHKLVIDVNDKIIITKGGITGTSVTLKWENNKEPVFLTLTGFGLASMNRQPINGIAFNTGNVNSISNNNLGLLLTRLLKQESIIK